MDKMHVELAKTQEELEIAHTQAAQTGEVPDSASNWR